jgi:hypothetical protein
MIELAAKPILSDKTVVGTVGPDTQELQNIKNMIFSLQLDLQKERSKREILEEKLRKLEGNLTRPSQEMRASEWELSDNLGLNLDVSQNQPLVPPRNMTKGVDEKIGDLSLEFHRKFRNLGKSLSEMRSVLANNLGCGLKGSKKIQAGPSEVKDYNRFVYKKLERGIFPRQISLKNALVKSLDELLNKPCSEKTEIESSLDQYYLDNLPPAFLQPDDVENEDVALGGEKSNHLFTNPLSRGNFGMDSSENKIL